MLIQGSEAAERRTLTIVGVVVALCAVLAALLTAYNPFASRGPGLMSVTIDTPFVGQGVDAGTAVVLHGVTVGKITAVRSLAGGGVRLNIDLQETPVAGLTNTMKIDFRPINYFGVTGVNLISGNGGQPLRDGAQINTVPKGNFTLQTLLSRLGAVTQGVITPQLIQVIDRATRFTDGLDPLIETAMITANAVAQVQTVSTERLLTNATGLSVVFPSTADVLVQTGRKYINNNDNTVRIGWGDIDEQRWQERYATTLEEASDGLFTAVGRLLSSHVGDLLPVINTIQPITDVVPPLIRPEGFADMLAELRSRFEQMYAGTPEQRALQVRIVLDPLPGVAAPVAAIGGP